ncbi:hypothetical protein BRC80_05810 [Halobacteriales archaeon QH_9_66_26]|nr:MAG: hypothetical protein BRC80_05810 [Halobacteriales archaeon QH_9_66_26]
MPLDSHRLLEESVLIGGLLLAWYVLSAFVAVIASGSFLGTLSVGFRIVGSATAVVFVIYRGVAIARGTRPVCLSSDIRGLLDESTVVAVSRSRVGRSRHHRPTGVQRLRDLAELLGTRRRLRADGGCDRRAVRRGPCRAGSPVGSRLGRTAAPGDD